MEPLLNEHTDALNSKEMDKRVSHSQGAPDEPESLEPEKVVLLSPGKSSDIIVPNSTSQAFVDEIDRIMDSTDKLFFKESQLPVTEPFTNYDVTSMFEVLDGQGQSVLLLGRCRKKDNVTSFVIANNAGHGVLTLTTSGCLNHICNFEGAGILKFSQISQIFGGYLLRDPYKELLRIRSGWVPFCTFCLLSSTTSATMAVVNLDGSPTGTISYKKWINLGIEQRTLCVHFIPNLNYKAKYMLFAASLDPLCSYFSEPGKSSRSVILIVLYVLLFLLLLVVTGVITLKLS